MTVRRGQAFPGLLIHFGRIVGQPALIHVSVQRKDQVLGHTIFLHIQRSTEDQVRIRSRCKHQRQPRFPFRILDVFKLDMNARLPFNLLKIPQILKINGLVLHFILHGPERHALRLFFCILLRAASRKGQQKHGFRSTQKPPDHFAQGFSLLFTAGSVSVQRISRVFTCPVWKL